MMLAWNRIKSSLLAFLLVLPAVLVTACAPGVQQKKGGKTCLDCHAEYRQRFSAGKVHQPVAKGNCAACHRKHGLIGGAYLKASVPNICFTCHKEMAAGLGESSTLHAPVKEGRCDLCHQPHNAAGPFLLAEARNAICFSCHEQQEFIRKYRHAPLEKGCETCHATHGSTAGMLLHQPETQLCADCHDLKNPDFVSSHGGYPVSQGCSECHAVHSADNPTLLKSSIHSPVAMLNCQKCHQPVKNGQPFTVIKAADDLCADCHADDLRSFSVPGVHSPVAAGDCTGCHQVHASDFTGLLQKDPQQLCFDCHEFKSIGPAAPAQGSGHQHTPAMQGDCLSCHAPHTPVKGQSKLLRKDGNQLCLDCHAELAAGRKFNHQPAHDGDCLDCHLPHESVLAGVLVQPQRKLCGNCHDQVAEDLGLPSIHRPFVAGQCSACHNPHGAELAGLMRKTGAASCADCHGRTETERQQPNRHQPFKEGQCDLCHQPHGSRQPYLLAQETAALCVDCHAGKSIEQDTPAGHLNCSVCHRAHGNSEVNYLLQEQPQLCLNCHAVDRYWSKGIGHQPAVEGDCLACHDPHAPQKSRAKAAGADLCGDCHAVDADTLANMHSGLTPSQNSCLGCHDPHGGPDRSLTLPVKHAPFAEGDCTPCHTGGKK